MKKVVAIAAFLTLLVTLGVSCTLAGAAVTPANGNDFVLPNGDVYQLDNDGVFHPIADVGTANAMHIDWNALQQVDSIDGEVGATYSTATVQLSNARVASTVKVTPANGMDFILPNGNLYQLTDDGTYRLVPDVATANAMHVDWNALQSLDDLGDAEGAPFPSVLA